MTAREKGSITIRQTAIPSMLVNFSTFTFLLNVSFLSKENIKFLGIGPYLYSTTIVEIFISL